MCIAGFVALALVTGIPGVVADGAQWTLVWQGTDNADGIVATPDGGLLFAQEQPNRVGKIDSSDRVSIHLEGTHGAGSLAIDTRGQLIAVERTCTDPGRRPAACDEATSVTVLMPERKVLANAFGGRSLGRLNDLVVDRRGGVYFNGSGTFYVDPAGRVSSIGHDIQSNGLMLSPDEKTLYVTNGATIVAFDVQRDGGVTNQREFARLEAGGSGDGMAIDNAGRLYVTSRPGVQVFAPDGKYLGVIATPRPSISVAFAGPGKQTLYIVGTGALGPDGQEFRTPDGIRNNAKTIYKLPMLAQGFAGRAK
jgi:gluconolactonase